MTEVQTRKFRIHHANIECGVVNHQLCTGNKFTKLVSHLSKHGRTGLYQPLVGNAVNFLCFCINIALRVDVLMVVTPGQLALNDLHAADFNDAVSLTNTGCFSIQHHLSHDTAPLLCD